MVLGRCLKLDTWTLRDGIYKTPKLYVHYFLWPRYILYNCMEPFGKLAGGRRGSDVVEG